MLVNARQIKACLAIVKAGNFTRASAAIHVSQSALSVQIRQLEDALGVQLFDRSRRHVSLTAIGRDLMPRFERILRELEAVALHTRDLSELTRGVVTVAAIPSIASTILPKAIRRLTDSYPGLTVRVCDTVAQRVADLVKSGEVDFGIGSLGKTDREVVTDLLMIDRFCAFVAPDYAIDADRAHTLIELTGFPLILPVRESSVRMMVDKIGARVKCSIKPAYEAVYNSTVLGLARDGLGVAIMPESMVDIASDPSLRAIKIHRPAIERRISLITRRGHSLSKAALILADRLKDVV
jgi:LysR family transcriptional regulator, carnitine catabolism transcriptional activator